MAVFDLKNADIYLVDGFTGTAAVNLMAGYTAGATTMAIDLYVGALAVGDRFTIAGETGTPIHTITAHTETSTNTTSITFTPGLATGGVVDDAVITFLGHRVKIRVGEGNLTYSEKRTIVYVKDRGKLDTVRKGDEEPVDVKLDFTWVNLSSESSAAVPTIEEALKFEGPASTWLSSSSDQCEPKALDVYILYTPPCSTAQPELIILPDFRYEDLQHDLKTAQVASTGKCNVVAATKSRAASFVF